MSISDTCLRLNKITDLLFITICTPTPPRHVDFELELLEKNILLPKLQSKTFNKGIVES